MLNFIMHINESRMIINLQARNQVKQSCMTKFMRIHYETSVFNKTTWNTLIIRDKSYREYSVGPMKSRRVVKEARIYQEVNLGVAW